MRSIDTLYGKITLHEPVLIDLIESKTIQRLKHIHQYGVIDYIIKPQNFTRYDHSIRVMTLLRMINAPLTEQIAGLLHDASHTVFSHLADTVFQTPNNEAYQDTIHDWYLAQTDIPNILQAYGFTLKDILHKNGSFLALEQNLPNLCADRISYIIDGGYIAHKIPKKMIRELLEHLTFEDGLWFFDSYYHARFFADVALYLTNNIFATPWNIMMNYWVAQAVQQALTMNIITLDDMHFGTDDDVWQRLMASSDKTIQENVQKAFDIKNSYTISYDKKYDLHITSKFRGVDPYIKHHHSMIRLSEYDNIFRKKFERDRSKVNNGWNVQIA